MNAPKDKKCKVCPKTFTPYRTTDRYCSPECARKDQGGKKKRKRINSVSEKQGARNKLYAKQRKAFLSRSENKICFIEGCGKPATTIEHTMGRKGYADDWARENGIWLLNDSRHFAPCCLKHNLELENNPELARAYKKSRIHGGKIDPKTKDNG